MCKQFPKLQFSAYTENSTLGKNFMVFEEHTLIITIHNIVSRLLTLLFAFSCCVFWTFCIFTKHSLWPGHMCMHVMHSDCFDSVPSHTFLTLVNTSLSHFPLVCDPLTLTRDIHKGMGRGAFPWGIGDSPVNLPLKVETPPPVSIPLFCDLQTTSWQNDGRPCIK